MERPKRHFGSGSRDSSVRGNKGQRPLKMEQLERRLALAVALSGPQVLFESDLVDPINVQTADIDSDGHEDVVAQSKFDQRIVWFRNGQDETFERPRFIASPIEVDPLRILGRNGFGDVSPPEIHLWDVDADSDLDIVVAWWRDFNPSTQSISGFGEVVWHENVVGDGTVWREHLIGRAKTKINIFDETHVRTARGDFNGDQRDDLAVLWTSVENNQSPFTLRYEVIWFAARNDGTGFAEEQLVGTFAASPRITHFSAADHDSDGDLDLAVLFHPYQEGSSHSTDSRLAWFENGSGLGEFEELAALLETKDSIISASFVDLDEDGDRDLLVEASRDRFPHRVKGWYQRLSTGHLSDELLVITSIDSNHNPIPSSAATIADLDGDGRNDVIVAGAGNNDAHGIAWFSYDQAVGNFALQGALPAQATVEAEWNFITTMDTDLDGDLDVLASYAHTNFDTNEIQTSLFLWNDFNSASQFGLPQVVDRIAGRASIARHDIASGHGDFLVWSSAPLDQIVWLRIAAVDAGARWWHHTIMKSPGFEDAWRIRAIDSHGNGAIDLLGVSPGTNYVAGFTFAEGYIGGIGEPNWRRSDVEFYQTLDTVQMTDKGVTDILYTSLGEVGWIPGGRYGRRPIFTPHSRVNAATAGDIDDDGDADVIVSVGHHSEINGPQIMLLENLRQRGRYDLEFATPRSLSSVPSRHLQLADVDGDGVQELLTDGAVLTSKDGFASLELLAPLDPQFTTIATADFDGDGDLDLLRRRFQELVWFEFDHVRGTYGDPNMLPWVPDDFVASAFNVTDLDNDGDPDIVALNRRAYWFENLSGQGPQPATFGLPKPIGGMIPARFVRDVWRVAESIQPVDWEGDGDTDLIATLRPSGQTIVALYVNESTIDRPLAGDFDGNGHVSQRDLDFVLAFWGTDWSDVPQNWTGQPRSGLVDQTELDAVLTNWGRSAEQPPDSSFSPAEALRARANRPSTSRMRDAWEDDSAEHATKSPPGVLSIADRL